MMLLKELPTQITSCDPVLGVRALITTDAVSISVIHMNPEASQRTVRCCGVTSGNEIIHFN